MDTCSPTEIRHAITTLFPPDSVVELRALKVRGKTHAGYFNDPEALAKNAATLSGKAVGVYVVLNEINPDLLARAMNRMEMGLQPTTQDADILRRWYLPIDIDARRPANISASEAEHEAAIDTAREVRTYLMKQGIPSGAIIAADSGNGAHLLVKLDLPNDDDAKLLTGQCLQALAAQFDNNGVSIDTTVFNAARIWKLYGTLAKKGDSTSDRPHRIAKLLYVPDDLVIASPEVLETIAATAPKEAQRDDTEWGFVLGDWLTKHNIEVQSSAAYQGGIRYILRECPFNREHTGSSVAVFQYANGALGFKCQHNSCIDKHWRDFRDLIEPGRRDSEDDIRSYLYKKDTTVTISREANRDKSVTDSVTGLVTEEDTSLSRLVEEWVRDTISWWTTEDLDKDLAIASKSNKDNRRQILKRLREAGVVEQHQKINKQFRYINKVRTALDFKRAKHGGALDIHWPLGIERFVNIFPGNLVVFAGAPNAGKTACMLKTIHLNQGWPAYYFCSEMGDVELADRLSKFPGMDIDDWKFDAVERSSDFADVIVPDALNIIDYLEMTDDLYKVNSYLTAINHRLGTGIAVVAVQKKEGAKMGRGQEFGLEKPKLYLALDRHRARIVKGKSWARKNVDPNGYECRFKIVDGCQVIITEDWHSPEDKDHGSATSIL